MAIQVTLHKRIKHSVYETKKFFLVKPIDQLYFFLVPFQVVLNNTDKLFNESASTTFTCVGSSISEDLLENYTWFVNSTTQTASTAANTLTLANLSAEHEGSYSCQINFKSKQTIRSAPFELNILQCKYLNKTV